MTNIEWNKAIEWLGSGDEGDWVEHEGRSVDIVSMMGGRYLLTDENGEIAGLVDQVWQAVHFLRTGEAL